MIVDQKQSAIKEIRSKSIQTEAVVESIHPERYTHEDEELNEIYDDVIIYDDFPELYEDDGYLGLDTDY